jgi:hypothetical protein
MKELSAKKRFRLLFDPFTDRFDHIHNLKPLRELCTEVEFHDLGPVSRTRKMKTTKIRIGNEFSSFRPQSFALLFHR